MKRIVFKTILILGLTVILIYQTVYSVHVTEFAILTRFGKPVEIITQPGLKFKIPFIEEIIVRNKKLRLTSPPSREFLTLDKKNVLVSWYLLWQIADPLKFFQTVYNQESAESRLNDIASSNIGTFLGKIKFADLISTDKEKKEALSQLESQIKQFCQQIFLQNFGIKLREVRFTRFNFPGQNKASIFNRMKAERGRIATKYRSEGEGEAIKIKAAAEKEKRQILARADREARELRGEGEAEAAAIYRKAYALDPEFYKFLRTLDAYENFIDEKTTVILPQDSDLLKLLVNGSANQSKKR